MRPTLLLLSFLPLFALAQMSGTYRIGGPIPHYNFIQDAIDDLALNGIIGPVVLQIHPGTYTTLLNIPAIPGVGPFSTVTLEPANPGANDVTITADGSSAYHLWSISSDYVTLDGLQFIATGTAPTATLVLIRIQAAHVTVRNCTITNQYRPQGGPVFLTSMYYADDVTIADNVITNDMSNGVCAFGTGIYADHSTDLVFRGNTVSRVLIGILCRHMFNRYGERQRTPRYSTRRGLPSK